MSRFRIEAAQRYLRDGIELLVIEVSDRGRVVLEAIETGHRQVLSRQDAEIEILSGELVLQRGPDGGTVAPKTPLDMLPSGKRAAALRRERYVQVLRDTHPHVSILAKIDHIIMLVAQELGDPNPPHRSTVNRWYRVWKKGGCSIAALVGSAQKRQGRYRGLDGEARRLISDILDEKYLTREQKTLQAVIDSDIIPRFVDENRKRPATERLKLPSRASIYRMVDEIDPYEKMRAREGELAANRYFKCSGAGIRAEAPLDYVLIDHTEIDLETVPAWLRYVARPTLTVALDLYSAMPWGIHLGFAAPGYESLMMCLRNGIMSKASMLAGFPSIEGTWPCHGLPRKIILDNGLEFHSESLRDVCSTFGISIIHNPVRSPEYKGRVERFFRTVNDGLLSGLRGRTFSSIAKKGDYDPVKCAAIPFETFREAFFKWLVDVYARKFHRGLQGFPVEFWQKGVSKYPVDLPENVSDLNILLGEAETRTIQNSGIFIHNARYNCPELGKLFKRMGKLQKVKVKVDPLDLGMIYVFDQLHETYISVPCLDPNLRGLSKWQYRVIRKEIAEHRKAGESTYDIQTHLRG